MVIFTGMNDANLDLGRGDEKRIKDEKRVDYDHNSFLSMIKLDAEADEPEYHLLFLILMSAEHEPLTCIVYSRRVADLLLSHDRHGETKGREGNSSHVRLPITIMRIIIIFI